MKIPRKATLKDVADAVGVTPQTVSNVLSGNNMERSAAVRERGERIRAAAARLNYRPNHAARAVRTSKTHTIGLLVWGVANPASGKIVDLFEAAFQRHGYRLLLGVSGGRLANPADYLRRFPVSFVDGVINADSFVAPDLAVEALRPLPVLNYNRSHPFSPAWVDPARMTRLAMEHLLGLGHRRIGLLQGPADDPMVQSIRAVYAELLGRQGIVPEAAWMEGSDWDLSGTAPAVRRLLGAGCTAILGGNDWSTWDAVKTIRRAGLRVPEDVSVVSSDDLPLATLGDPELTALRFPFETVVEKHVEAMLALLKGRPLPPLTVLDGELVVRASTAPPGKTPFRLKSGREV